MFDVQHFTSYWSTIMVQANVFIILHLLGAMLLGMVVGYERAYNGRAAGMRTYALVCMASAALTVIGGYSHFWYGGGVQTVFNNGDLTRVIQGIVTGVGFLCAGVIMKDGLSISGLTTAASIWAASGIGVLVGVGLYMAAIALALLSLVCMMWVTRLEGWLPARQALALMIEFQPGANVVESVLEQMANERGYDLAKGSIVISMHEGALTWNFVAVARSRKTMAPLSELAREIAHYPGVRRFNVAYARN